MMPTAQDDTGVDESLYNDEPTPKADNSGDDSVDEESTDNEAALLPLSAFPDGVKAGDAFTGKVVKVHGDKEVEVQIGPEESKEPSADEPSPEEDMMGA